MHLFENLIEQRAVMEDRVPVERDAREHWDSDNASCHRSKLVQIPGKQAACPHQHERGVLEVVVKYHLPRYSVAVLIVELQLSWRSPSGLFSLQAPGYLAPAVAVASGSGLVSDLIYLLESLAVLGQLFVPLFL